MVDENLRAWAAIDSTRGIGPRAVYKIALGLRSGGLEAGDLLARGHDEVLQAMRSYGASEKSAVLLAESLSGRPEVPDCPPGVVILHPDRPEYPFGRLDPRRPLPAVLYARGSTFLLDQPGVAIVGSRDAAVGDVELAQEVAQLLGAKGSNVVSGHARGVDHAAHVGAVAGGGTTTAILAEGITRFSPREGVTGDSHSLLVVSQFPPESRWRPHQAMARNATVAALAKCVVVIRSGETGGTREMVKLSARTGLPVVGVESHIPEPLHGEIDYLVAPNAAAVVESVELAAQGTGLTLF